MTKLIEAEQLIADIESFNRPLCDDYHMKGYVLDLIIADIKSAPTVDAVPVIRCKDCKSYEERVSFNGLFSGYCNCVAHMTNEDCFCSWAERKEE